MDGEVVCDGVSVNSVGIEMGPMRVERVLSVQMGLRNSERLDRAFLPISKQFESKGT